jgi:tetratricopeptide (TPR) repeat protein
MQSIVAQVISANLRSQLSDAQKQQVAKHYTEDPNAYQLYLQGRFHQNKWTLEGINTSIKYFQQAIAKDTNYAVAYTALATSYIMLGSRFNSQQEVIPQARANVQMALKLDDTLADAHAVYASILRSYDWNWEKAEQESQRAVQLNPNHADAYNQIGQLFLILGRTADAIAAFQRQLELDPPSLPAHNHLVLAYTFARQFEQAIAVEQKAIELEPNLPLTYVGIGQIYGFQREYSKAMAELDRAAEKAKEDSDLLNIKIVRAQVYARMGRREDAQKILAELLASPNYIRPHTIALVYAALGENDQAFEWLEKAERERSPYLASLRLNPSFDNLHADQRFQALLTRLKLNPEARR